MEKKLVINKEKVSSGRTEAFVDAVNSGNLAATMNTVYNLRSYARNVEFKPKVDTDKLITNRGRLLEHYLGYIVRNVDSRQEALVINSNYSGKEAGKTYLHLRVIVLTGGQVFETTWSQNKVITVSQDTAGYLAEKFDLRYNI
jgi:hypothetical protein